MARHRAVVMRIATWNIQHLEPYVDGVDSSAEFARALSELNADLVLLQEVDHFQERSGNVDQTAFAASLVGAQHSHFVATPPIPGNYGIAAVARKKVLEWRHKLLPGSPIGMRLTFLHHGEQVTFYTHDHQRAVMTATVDGGWLVANMHSSFVPGWAHFLVWRAARWARAQAKQQGLRLVFCGDLNLKSHWFLKFCGLRSLTHTPTFPAWQPDQHIDHICVERNDPAVAISERVERFGVSDHCALVVEIQ